MVTKDIDKEIVVTKSQTKDVVMDRQHGKLFKISNKIEWDNHHGNPDDLTDPKVLFYFNSNVIKLFCTFCVH